MTKEMPAANAAGISYFTAHLSWNHNLSVPVRRLLFRERLRELHEKWAEMRPVAEQVRGAASACEQKCDRREISFGRVTGLACEDEIVAPIVGRLAASWGYVVECHQDRRESLAAVGTDGSVLFEKPSPRLGVCDSPGGVRCQLNGAVRCASFGALLSASPAPPGA